ncbi:hypothetical protein HDU77_010461 [Chytriomyces hyalinus]|nr:hypothetical protein HDU77_010461 [Chytriomyces hyalinus]
MASSLSFKAPRYISEYWDPHPGCIGHNVLTWFPPTTAFLSPKNLFVFLPFPMIAVVLDHLVSIRVRFIIIVPQSFEAWWPHLQAMSGNLDNWLCLTQRAGPPIYAQYVFWKGQKLRLPIVPNMEWWAFCVVPFASLVNMDPILLSNLKRKRQVDQ